MLGEVAETGDSLLQFHTVHCKSHTKSLDIEIWLRLLIINLLLVYERLIKVKWPIGGWFENPGTIYNIASVGNSDLHYKISLYELSCGT
jgi:hypothetical protein